MTLLNARVEGCYVVEGLELAGTVQRRLQALGLIPGTTIKVLNNKRSGSVIFHVRGTRLAVGKKIAAAIVVREDCHA